jgi:hypothetical protein
MPADAEVARFLWQLGGAMLAACVLMLLTRPERK